MYQVDAVVARGSLTVKHDHFIKRQLASRNELDGVTW